MNKTILVLLATLSTAGAAQAQTQAQTTTDTAPHAYVGIGIANAENRMVDAWKPDAKFFAGYQFDRNFGVETGFTRFGRVGVDVPGLYGDDHGRTKGSSSYIAGTYTLPLNERVAAFGKLGVSYNERSYVGNFGALGEHDTGVYAGAGLQVKLTDKLALTGEYERYGKKKTLGAKADVFTLGLKYGF